MQHTEVDLKLLGFICRPTDTHTHTLSLSIHDWKFQTNQTRYSLFGALSVQLPRNGRVPSSPKIRRTSFVHRIRDSDRTPKRSRGLILTPARISLFVLSIICLFLAKIFLTFCFFLLCSFIYVCLKVFTGCVKDWAALVKWNPSNGGLDYLQVFFFFFSNYALLIVKPGFAWVLFG
jgi:hypothetical protein